MSSQNLINLRQKVIKVGTFDENEWYYCYEKKAWVMVSKKPPEVIKYHVQKLIEEANILRGGLN